MIFVKLLGVYELSPMLLSHAIGVSYGITYLKVCRMRPSLLGQVVRNQYTIRYGMQKYNLKEQSVILTKSFYDINQKIFCPIRNVGVCFNIYIMFIIECERKKGRMHRHKNK